MEIAAAAPTIPWSDLVHSLTPNGGTLDTEVTSPTDDLAPLGIMKLSYQNILYGSGMATGFYSPKGVDPSADLTGWFELESAGEPYDGNPAIRALSREIAHNHSAYYLKHERPARSHADLERLHRRPVPGRRGGSLREQGVREVPARRDLAAALRLRAPARPGQGRRHAPGCRSGSTSGSTTT